MCVVPVHASVGEVLPWLLQVVSAPLHSMMRCRRAAPVWVGVRGGVEGRGVGLER